jgi:hypothetical protein
MALYQNESVVCQGTESVPPGDWRAREYVLVSPKEVTSALFWRQRPVAGPPDKQETSRASALGEDISFFPYAANFWQFGGGDWRNCFLEAGL